MNKFLPVLSAALLLSLACQACSAAEIHVSPNGDNSAPGTAAKPLATLGAAQLSARKLVGHEPVTVLLHTGVYYLPETLRFTAADSGSEKCPVIYAAVPGQTPIISGGLKLKLEWTPFREGIQQAKTTPGFSTDQLFVNGERLPMARYPNVNPAGGKFDGTAPDAIAPERVAKWADPAGGFIHAMHSALWGGMHYRIKGKNADGSLDYEGGWQNNRTSGMHQQFRMVENIFEELDAPGEWFLDRKQNLLFCLPPAGVNLNQASIEGVRLTHLIEVAGTKEQPVRFITFRGIAFRHAARTFMETKDPLVRTDWTIYRGGALLFRGAEDTAVVDCEFDRLGGNTLFADGYNRRITVRGCYVHESGGNGVAFVGNPKAAYNAIGWQEKNAYAAIDKTPGPRSDDYPADCLVEECLIERTGRVEKQTAGVEIDLARGITVRHCTIHDVPRSGINIGDGCWGGHLVENCDVFDTVKETGDHGSFNSWGRDRFWDLAGIPPGELPKIALLDCEKPIVLLNNRWRCDHGWDVDLDDGSSNYRIYNNLFLNGGLKLREGFRREATNNIMVNNGLHPHVWFESSGDVVTRNILMGAHRPAVMKVKKWGAEVDRNLFTTSDADRIKFAASGCDANSIVGDPKFIDPAHGDFRVGPDSPALKIGFVNFPMDQFGVTVPRLKALAPQPVFTIPGATAAERAKSSRKVPWLGATFRELEGMEFSAVGVPQGAKGMLAADLPSNSPAYIAGLRANDFILSLGGHELRGAVDFAARLKAIPSGMPVKLQCLRGQKSLPLTVNATNPSKLIK